MRKAMFAIGIFMLALVGAAISSAGAWWDDSQGSRGVRAYGCGPPCGGGYFSGVIVRVREGRVYHYYPRHIHRRERPRY
jgi:hypothetical protein